MAGMEPRTARLSDRLEALERAADAMRLYVVARQDTMSADEATAWEAEHEPAMRRAEITVIVRKFCEQGSGVLEPSALNV